MPGGKFHPAEAGFLEAARTLAEVFDRFLNAVPRHLPRHGPAKVVRQRRGRPGLLRPARLPMTAPGILKLPQQSAAPALHGVGPAGQCVAPVRPEQGGAVRPVMPGQHVQRLGHDHAHPARGTVGVIAHQARIDVLVLRITRAHRRVDHAVAHGAPGQRDRFKQKRIFHKPQCGLAIERG